MAKIFVIINIVDMSNYFQIKNTKWCLFIETRNKRGSRSSDILEVTTNIRSSSLCLLKTIFEQLDSKINTFQSSPLSLYIV